MKKQLRIGFAMGGGVSLGTFSGSALTEALKLLLIDTYTSDDSKYDEVIIDVFSGASAGAIALGIMIRSMISYEDKLVELNRLDKYNGLTDVQSIKDLMWENLKKEYPILSKLDLDVHRPKREEIITCQIAQDFQQLIWVESATIEGLADLQNKKTHLHTAGSVLSGKFLDEVANNLLYPAEDNILTINLDSPVSDRFLFSCTLTRLSSETIDSFSEFRSPLYSDAANKFLQELLPIVAKDGASSENHKDFRVFDIDISSQKGIRRSSTVSQPSRWVKIVNGASGIQKNEINVQDKSTWKMITQTSLACGAFPFAFEPKALERRGFELSADGKADDETFAYIDGGVLNNEPISEAFKLAAFMDGIYEEDEFDRFIIFVDPSINHSVKTKANKNYQKYVVSEENGETLNRTGLLRTIDQLSPLLRVIRDQATISELDKASDVQSKFRKREQLREMYKATVRLGFPKEWNAVAADKKEEIVSRLNDVLKMVNEEIKGLQTKIAIPSSFPFKAQEARKMMRADAARIKDKKNHFKKKFISLFATYDAANQNANLLENPAEFIAKHNDLIQDYVIFLYFLMIDATVDLIGKNDNYALLPIGPVEIKNGRPRHIELLGQPFSGFLGFIDQRIRKSDFEQGRQSACDIMQHLGLVGNYKSPWKPYLLADNSSTNQAIAKEITEKTHAFAKERIIDGLINRNGIEYLNRTGDGVVDSFIDAGSKLLVRCVSAFINSKLKKVDISQRKSISVEIRIMVSDKDFEINDQTAKTERGNDIAHFANNGSPSNYELIMHGDYQYRQYAKDLDQWAESRHIVNNNIVIDLDTSLFWNDKQLCEIKLPFGISDNEKYPRNIKHFLYPIIEIDITHLTRNDVNKGKVIELDESNEKKVWWFVEGKEADD